MRNPDRTSLSLQASVGSVEPCIRHPNARNVPVDIEAKAAEIAKELLEKGADIQAQHEVRHKEFLISSVEIEKVVNCTNMEDIMRILLSLAEVEDYLLKD